MTDTVVETPAPGHDYGEPEWIWSADNCMAVATFTCANCGDKQVLIDENPVAQEVEAVSVSKDQVVKYTATVTFNGEEYTADSDEMTQKNPFGVVGRIIALFRKLAAFLRDLIGKNQIC